MSRKRSNLNSVPDIDNAPQNKVAKAIDSPIRRLSLCFGASLAIICSSARLRRGIQSVDPARPYCMPDSHSSESSRQVAPTKTVRGFRPSSTALGDSRALLSSRARLPTTELGPPKCFWKLLSNT